MYRFETRKGEIAHLTSKDCQEVFAILTAIKILHPSTPEMLAGAIRACMCDNNPEPWTVIHDEDLVALHRRDDNKPVLLFVTKENA
jgi:pyruvate/2-oxoglutarate/acetoin dehydrogenase E1 component